VDYGLGNSTKIVDCFRLSFPDHPRTSHWQKFFLEISAHCYILAKTQKVRFPIFLSL